MQLISRYFRIAALYGASIMLACGYPLTALAEEAPATSTPPTTVVQAQSEPPAPSVAPSAPSSSSTSSSPSASSSAAPVTPSPKPPKPKETYTYDAATGRWNSSRWQYDVASNSYKKVLAPAPAQSTPVAKVETPAQQVAPTTTSSPKSTSSTKTTTDSTTNSAITNALDSLAKTGNSDVTHNTSAGNATTGSASASATVINNVNSSLTNGSNKEAASFVSDVVGDVNGDIMLQPMLLKAMLEAGAANSTQATVNNNTNINNDLSLKATSGDANVAGNTKAGSATSGSASTVANVMNLLNSMIAANQSFVGTINIYGNLNGDILIAPDFIPQMLANNASSISQKPTSTVVNATDTQSIVNNVALAAESGQALVNKNTSAGNATTGAADTNLVIFNLSGHQIVASNSLLVFVNVLGKWVGVIVDAPTGATAAALGNNVTKNSVAPSVVIDAQSNAQITNNIQLASQSGNASVTGNTFAGNATTGSATASANIANIANSQLGLSGWFGVLFINVFGNWTGSFGVDTAAGNPIATFNNSATNRAQAASRPLKVFDFVPHQSTTSINSASSVIVAPAVSAQKATTASATIAKNPYVVHDSRVSDIPAQSITVKQVNMPLAIASIALIGVSIFGLRRFLF